MSNASANLAVIEPCSAGGPAVCNVAVKGSTHIYKGTVVSQHSGGYFVPGTTSGGGSACGIAQHEMNNASATDGAARVTIEFMRAYAFPNGTSGDAFSDASKFGAPVYMTDDHTAAAISSTATRKCIGWFQGFESDGKVRVFLDPGYAYLINALNALVLLTDSPASADALRDNIVASLAAGLL